VRPLPTLDKVFLPTCLLVAILIGLLLMMWPILTKVQYERLPAVFSTPNIWQQIALSMLLNWVIAPFVMLGVAWATLPENKLAGERQGVVLVGIARCIGEYLVSLNVRALSGSTSPTLKLWSSFGADSLEGTRICAQSSYASTRFFRLVTTLSWRVIPLLIRHPLKDYLVPTLCAPIA
jgi:hypothetical protein